MNSVSIGYYRHDVDFALLATLNNTDCHLSDAAFLELVVQTMDFFKNRADLEVVALERQDAPDYLDIV